MIEQTLKDKAIAALAIAKDYLPEREWDGYKDLIEDGEVELQTTLDELISDTQHYKEKEEEERERYRGYPEDDYDHNSDTWSKV